MPGPPMRRSRPSWWISPGMIGSDGASATGSGGVGSGTGSGPGSGSGTGSGVGSGTGSGVGSGGGSVVAVSVTGSFRAALPRAPPLLLAVTLTSSGGTDSSVERKRSARGPSRMLARFLRAMSEDLLREVAVRARGLSRWVVLEDGAAADRRLGELDRLADPGLEDELAEVLLEDLHCLLGVDGPRVEHRRQDSLDLDAGGEVLPDHREGVLKLDEAAHREVLALDRHDHLVGGGECVHGQQSEAGRRVDADEVVVIADAVDRLLQRPLAADLGAHRYHRAGEIDGCDRDVYLAGDDDLRKRDVVDEHVEHALLDLVRIYALGHGQVALRVHVDAEDAVAGLLEGDGEVESGGRLGDAALLVSEGDDLGRALVLGLVRLLGLGRSVGLLLLRVLGPIRVLALLLLGRGRDEVLGAHAPRLVHRLRTLLSAETSHLGELFRRRGPLSCPRLEESAHARAPRQATRVRDRQGRRRKVDDLRLAGPRCRRARQANDRLRDRRPGDRVTRVQACRDRVSRCRGGRQPLGDLDRP